MERIAAQILDGRGISDPQQAMQYISCDSAARLHDPFLMQDMDKAVERLSEAVEQGEQIAVYGDYDCDGITATAMLYSTWRIWERGSSTTFPTAMWKDMGSTALLSIF